MTISILSGLPAADIPVRQLAILGILLAFAVWVFLLLQLGAGGRSEKLPANLKPYMTDDELEGSKVVKTGLIGLGIAVGLAVVMAAYWLWIPHQQAFFADKFRDQSIEYGAALFQPTTSQRSVRGTEVFGLGCATCHGGGQGDKIEGFYGPDKTVKVEWECPQLNDVFYRFTRDEVKQILTYGRPGTPMPAWGLAGGGPKTDQEIEDLLNYLKSIEVSPDQAKQKAGFDGTNRITDGKQLFLKNCARCHTTNYSIVTSGGQPITLDQRADLPQGNGAYGPPLTNETIQFPDEKKQEDFIKAGSVSAKPYGVRGVGNGRMPGFQRDSDHPLLDDDQIAAVAAYERTLKPAEPGATGATTTTPTVAASTTPSPSPSPSPSR